MKTTKRIYRREKKEQRTKLSKELLILFTFCISFISVQMFFDSTEIGDAVVATEASAVCDNNGGAEKETDTPSFAEPSYPSFVKKMTDIELYVWNEVEKAGLDPVKASKVVKCESNWQPEASFINQKHNSIDRGLWMINSYYHSEVSPTCAYDYRCATKEAIRIAKERGWREWTCGIKLNL